MRDDKAASVAEITFALLLGPTWATILVGLWLVQPAEYQMDLYAEVGPWVWTAMLAGIGTSFFMVFYSPGRAWMAYANLVALFGVAIAIPALIGYFVYGRADALSIIGSMAATLQRGEVRPINLYPGTDFLGTSVALATGLSAPVVFQVLAYASSLLLLGVSCLLARLALPPKAHPAGYAAAFVLYFAWMHATGIPNFIFVAVAAVYVYLAVALPQRGISRLIVLLVLAVPVTVGHPFVAAFVVLALVLLAVVNPFGNKVDLFLAAGLVALSLAVLVFTNEGLSLALERRLDQFRDSNVVPVSGEASTKADRLEVPFLGWLKFIVFYLGRYWIPFAAVALAWAARPRDWHGAQRRWVWALLAAGAAMEMLLLFNPFISHTIIRVVNLNYMVFGLVPLFALALALLAEEAGPTRLAAFGLAFLVSGVALLGAYDSPRTLLPNQEFGAEEVAGARWITTERGPSAIFNPLSGFEKRVMNLLYDTPRHENPLRPPREGIIPDHFAFPSPGGPVYLAVPRADIAKYTELYTQIERFSDRDVELLAQRGDVAQVYDSMGIDFYYHPGLRREA